MALRTLAKDCEFATTERDNQIKDQLITGTCNEAVRYELLKATTTSLNEMEQLAKTVEMASAHKPTKHTRDSTETAELHAIRPAEANQQFRKYSDNRGNRRNFDQRRDSRQQMRVSAGATERARRRQCYCCGKDNHLKAECSLRNKYCSEYGEKGHLFKMCTKRGHNTQQTGAQHRIDVEENEAPSSEDDEAGEREEAADMFMIKIGEDNRHGPGNRELAERTVGPHYETIKVNNIWLKMELDTGAAYSAISRKEYEKQFSTLQLSKASRTLNAYKKTPIRSVGYIMVNIENNNIKAQRILYVIPGGGPPLLGRSWLEALKMWPPHTAENKTRRGSKKVEQVGQVFTMTENNKVIEKLRTEFLNVFAEGLGTFTKGKLDLVLTEGAKPRFVQPRRIPIAMRELVEAEINRLKERGIISPVEYSEWGTPVVPILKGDGSIRLCGDFKVTLNKVLKIDHFPLPRVEEVLDVLRGGAIFTKLDLSEAYQQLPLTEKAKKLTVISTHLGLFQYNRLPFGVSTGPGSFQRVMTSLLLGITGVIVFIDDILVAAPDARTHTERVRLVSERLNEAGLRVKEKKCQFFQEEIKYLGFWINAQGIFPSKKNIESVKQAPAPKNVSELKSFLGSINYYARFIDNITNKLHALYECLKEKKFHWTETCQKSFDAIKNELSSELTLAHFDPTKQIVLKCDASPYGISAVLSHRESEKKKTQTDMFFKQNLDR